MPDMNTLASAVLNIKDLVSYQTGSVVSRTLIDKSVGTVTVFAFDHGQGLSEHTAPFDAFVQIIEGTADITIDGYLHTVKEGEMITATPALNRSSFQFRHNRHLLASFSLANG